MVTDSADDFALGRSAVPVFERLTYTQDPCETSERQISLWT